MRSSGSVSPFDDDWLGSLEALAAQLQLNHPGAVSVGGREKVPCSTATKLLHGTETTSQEAGTSHAASPIR